MDLGAAAWSPFFMRHHSAWKKHRRQVRGRPAMLEALGAGEGSHLFGQW
jgi:hypothetical protein